MKDIHEVLRQKQTKYAQLGKQIEMLQQAAEKLQATKEQSAAAIAAIKSKAADKIDALRQKLDDLNMTNRWNDAERNTTAAALRMGFVMAPTR